MRFSEREGFKPVRQALQIDSVDEPLRNGLWNALNWYILNNAAMPIYGEYGDQGCFYEVLWLDYYKRRDDEKPTEPNAFWREIEHSVFEGDWFEIYDLIEYVLQEFPFHRFPDDITTRKGFISSCKRFLEREMSAYRIVGDYIVRIVSEQEIEAIEEAYGLKDKYAPISSHICRSLELLSDRRQPDYRNAIKEAISAVESMCRVITNDPKPTLGAALRRLTENGVVIHPALKGALNQMYGYTNDAQGIRHAHGLTEEPDLDFEDAKFMLVSCSAFINLLKARSPT